MSNKEKLIIALKKVDDLVNLLEDNEWKSYLYRHLSTVKYELERQLHNE
jgi:DNA polymerase/3'-5' exonuclease PolX